MSIMAERARQEVPLPGMPVHRFSVKQYHRMIELGVLTENDCVELLQGWIVDKMPQHPSHAATVSVLARHLRERVPTTWIVRVQSPVTLDDSEPEPDLAVARGPEERYWSVHPTPTDLALVVEVADTTLDRDRGTKAALYAGARVPYYWIVNLIEVRVEVYSQPRTGKAPGYRRRQDFGIELGVPVVIGNRQRRGIAVRHLFPQ
jgi:Uma2 family endonuclease